jgi:hypothetical protein
MVMMLRCSFSVILVSLVAGVASAQVSLGVWAGHGNYRNEAFNREFAAPGVDGVRDGLEVGGSARIALSSR